MKKLLIVSKINDLSLPFFLFQSVQEKIEVDILMIEESEETIKDHLKDKDYEYFYVREVLTSALSFEEVEKRMTLILNVLDGKPYSVDNIRTFQDMLFEDKWIQYKKLKEFMPKTYLLSDYSKDLLSNIIIKKRISSRARNIFFNLEEFPKIAKRENYIAQEMLNVEKEFRVYSVFDKVIDTVAVKSPKTIEEKVKVMGTQKIGPELKEFVQNIQKKLQLDFAGYDIALLESGHYILIEANRGCFWNSFYADSSINLADNFVRQLLKRNEESDGKNS